MKKLTIFILTITLFTIIFSHTSPTQQALAESENSKKVQLGGEPFGIRMFSDGVLVIEVESTLYGSEIPSPAYLAGIRANDIIKSANGITLKTNEHFTEIISNSNKNELLLSIDREGQIIETVLTPQYDSQGNLRVGLWIKDSAAGIGTITYYDTENSTFGALGHGICESQTGKLIPLSYGEIAQASISDIKKSKKGNIGSLNGYFKGDIIGDALLNSSCGIFGKLTEEADGELIEVADKSEVEIGEAEIYCTLNDNVKKSYKINIKRLSQNSDNNMVIEITDPNLLEITGGIVQGMSGSPIVQNGKLVGAVTHVLVNKPTTGYGIFIENMLDAAA